MSVIDRIDVEIGANSSNFVAEFTKAGQAAEQFDAKLKGLGSSSFGDKIAGEATQVTSEFKKIEGAVDSLVAKLQKIDIGKNLQGVSNITGKLSTEMRNIGVAASLLSVPVDLFAKSSLDTYASLESQIKRNTALIGGGQKEYEELLALSKDLGGTTPFSSKGIAEGIESLAAAGYSLDDIKKTMGTVTEMSIASGEPLGSMSDILVNVLSQFQAGPDQANKFANVLAVGANESTASITDMGEALKFAGNISGIMNKDVEEFGAALAVMANNGIKGTMAGTGLVDVMGDLANPSLAGESALKKLGLTKEDIDPTTHSLEQLLTTLNQAGLAKPENTSLLFEIFGKQGAPKISSLISDEGLAQYKEIVRKMTYESDGAIQQFADSQRDSLAFAMDQIGESYTKIQEKVGEGLKPLVVKINDFLQENGDVLEEFAKKAVEGLTPLVEKFLKIAKDAMEWFNSLPSDTRSKIASLTGMGAALTAIGGPLLILGSVPIGALSNITGILSQLFTVAKGAGTATTLATGVTNLVTSLKGLSGITAVANFEQYLAPIGPAVGEVGLLTSALATLGGPLGLGVVVAVAGGIAAYATNFAGFRDNVNSVLTDLGKAASAISDGDYQEAGRQCGEAFVNGLKTAVDLFNAVYSWDTIINVSEFLSGVESELKEGFLGLGQSIGISMRELGASIPNYINQGMQASGDLITGAQKLGTDLVDKFKGAISNPSAALDAFVSAINGYKADISGFIQNIENQLKSGNWAALGTSAAQAFVNAFKIVNPIVGELFQGILDGATGKAGLTKTEKSKAAELFTSDYNPIAPEGSSSTNNWEYVGKTDLTNGVAQGVAAGVSQYKSGAPSITDWLTGMGKQGADPKKYQALYDKEFKVAQADTKATETATASTDNNTGATEELSGSVKELTSSVDSAKASTVSPPAAVVPVADQGKIFSGAPGGDKPTDEFTLDPKSYLDRKLANVFSTTEYKDLPAFEAYLKQFGKDLEYQANKWFEEEKDAGFGGNWNFTDWFKVATGEAVQSNEELKKTGDITEENTIEAKKFNTELSKAPKAIKEITDTAKKAKGTSESELSGTSGKFTVADASVIQCKALECTGDSTFTGDMSGDVALPSAIGCVFGGSASHVQLPTFDNAPWISAIKDSQAAEVSRIQGTWNQNSDSYYDAVAKKTASWGLKDSYLGDISGGNVYYNCKFGNVLQGSGQIESMRARGNDSSLISSFRGSPGGTGQPTVNTAASQQVDKAAASLNQLSGSATSFVQVASGGYAAGTQFNGVIAQINSNLQQAASGASAAAPAIGSLPPQLSALTSASNSTAASISSAVSRINSYIESASAAAAGMVAGAASGETRITVSGNTFNQVQNAGSFIADFVRNVRAGG